MRTLKLTTTYDGTAYAGWQRQENAPTVQAAVEDALAEIEGRRVVITGAGRTDAGVHALGQVASCRFAHAIGTSELRRALNAKLPPDIRIVEVEEVAETFHARFSAVGKIYRYRIDAGVVADPFTTRYAWHLPGSLDVTAMAQAGQVLVGRHDYAAFHTHASDSSVASTIRTIRRLEIQTDDRYLTVDVEGDGFLRHMVRTIVGTLVEVGRGDRAADELTDVLASGRRERAGPTAPAHGLLLVRVLYP